MCVRLMSRQSFFFNDTATTEIYTLSLHDALPIFAVVKERRRLRVKGIDILAEAARRLPGMTFIVIGVDSHLTGNVQPPLNMRFLPVMNRMELLPYYQRAKVYCLPSLREGLPNSLCEAMLCGCIPVA